MDFQTTLVSIWREACRHIEITESAAAIAQVLSAQMRFQTLVVRRLDLSQMQLQTVAVAPKSPPGLGPRTTPLSRVSMSRLLDWFSRRVIWNIPQDGAFDGLDAHELFGEIHAPMLIGGLLAGQTPAGILAVVGEPNRAAFSEEDVRLVQQLLEPFAVALENDQRLREMATLREAAEAEKRSLLAKLGRQSLSDAIIGAETGLKHVMERVELVAMSDAPVLLLGETGTGKELIARTIHQRSPRAKGPFLRVNCGAIPRELIDSQLFGHERGSFTGAVETHQGWFERANHGTLFLDEIGELPLDAQVRLLQVLQDGTFERVGGCHPITVDVRVVAATHRDLQEMVRQGQFREDLWYRLAVFPIYLPPLRERREDIPALARHFAQRAAVRFGLPLQLPTEEDIRALLSYHWPGNIRELAAVIDRAAILGNGRGLEVLKALGVTAVPSVSKTETLQPQEGDFPTLDEVMRRHIEEALRRCAGRIEGPRGAAALLGINPHTLRSRMRKMGICWAKFRTENGVSRS
ncbi:MAG: sigma 54-interacting transcriptional regulator [Thermogutta sp.]|nr:sigma 54-interacting transcriptional regulator [Thermogutta sp.]HPU06830.1 sigma 54-interacting transcriptional regulator [Thermogutta sp.]